MKKLVLVILFLLPPFSAEADPRVAALFNLSSSVYTQLALLLYPDHIQWMLIHSEGSYIDLNAVQFNQAVVLIHFDEADSHAVPFKLYDDMDNFNQALNLLPWIRQICNSHRHNYPPAHSQYFLMTWIILIRL